MFTPGCLRGSRTRDKTTRRFPLENSMETPEVQAERTLGSRKFWLDIHVWLRDLFLSLTIAGVVIIFLYQPVKVEGTSMMPKLQDQERIFVNKFVYSIDDINRGDLIVFRFPRDPSKSYIKRVVGLPDDHVEITGGRLYINGEYTEEPYVPPRYRDGASQPALDVPPDHFYVLGDHRNTSNDSRTWGTVDRTFVTGKAVFAYWPPERFGLLD